ncbi:HD domain-containing protein [Clostridium botulinum]|nr:metal-dependent phosphohydrolase [Clostridium botulinum]NFF24606.1 HD domain-containing protein [Clostridium botulinum]NFF37350.1 HD domain-containing protein [Clostridium botulinum]NFH74049.1 HD domain-containing protein [Clostridium botulinum]NFI02246.1 HD domain-containing protein [Clostridium botulinum]
MDMDMIENIKEDIKRRCESSNNFFGIGIYQHIESVANNAVELATLYQADVEVCEIAGWLHDIASITDYQLYENHHIHGANMAEKILNSYNYPTDKIELIKLCILNHRGSVLKEKTTKEEICVADADAISHYDTLPSLFYLAFVQRKLNIEDGVGFIKSKLERSYNKMSQKSKEHYKYKRDIIQAILR